VFDNASFSAIFDTQRLWIKHELSVPITRQRTSCSPRIVVLQRASEIKTMGRKVADDIFEMGAKFADVRDRLRHNKAGAAYNLANQDD